MNMLVKVLIGAAGVAAVGTVVAVVTKKEEKNNDVAEQAVKKDEDGSILKSINRFVKKKVIKFLAWVALHMEQIEAASAVIGLGSACFSIASAVRDFRHGNDIEEKLNTIESKIDSHAHTITHNQKVESIAAEAIAEKVGVDIDDVCKVMSDFNKESGYPEEVA